MQIGKLRHKVTIQYLSQTQTQTGSTHKSWVDMYDRVPASIIDVSSKENILSQKETSQITTRIVIRGKQDVNATMRVIHNRKGDVDIYIIHGVLRDNKSGYEYLTLQCERTDDDNRLEQNQEYFS